MSQLVRQYKQSWPLYKLIGESALATIGKVYDYQFVADFVKEQYDLVLGPNADPNVRAIWAIIDNDTLIGYINGVIFGNVCQEIGWYVIPSMRNGNHGRRLLKAMEDWARERKCKYVLITRFKEPEGKGYMMFKECFIKEIKDDV